MKNTSRSGGMDNPWYEVRRTSPTHGGVTPPDVYAYKTDEGKLDLCRPCARKRRLVGKPVEVSVARDGHECQDCGASGDG